MARIRGGGQRRDPEQERGMDGRNMAAQFALNPQLLKSVPLFSAFTDAQLSQVLACVQHRSYPRNSFILRAGEETDSVYIILSGRVKVLIPDEEGHEVILSIMGPHEFFGEMGLLDDQSRSASVETLEACEMLRLSKAGFIGILKDNFELAMLIIRNLVRRLREADRKIESLALIDVYGRVARLLIDMAQVVDGKWIVEHAPPKQEIARMIGASREMVSRVVKDLHRKGLIRAEKRRIYVLDKQSMQKRATTRHTRQS
jgi:CRP/FNR family transcriptional regulator, cyclic AMP receptor protein